MLTKLTLALTALAVLVAPARADCSRAQLGPMCKWEQQTAVEEWLAQQRADAEARARTWQLFGPQPSPARIEQVRLWLDEQR
jgi:Spy/CpxP family protein refolding chaperone